VRRQPRQIGVELGHDVTDGDRTYWRWTGDFELEPKDAAEMLKLIEGSWTTAIDAVKAQLGAETS
jgi:hypothetical protein